MADPFVTAAAEEQKFDFISHYDSLDPETCSTVESQLDFWFGKTFTSSQSDVIHTLGGDSLFYIHAESLILHLMTQRRESLRFLPCEPLKIMFQIDSFLRRVTESFGVFELVFIDDYQSQFDFYLESHVMRLVRSLILTCRKRMDISDRLHHFASYRGAEWSEFAKTNSQRPMMCFDGGYSPATRMDYTAPADISDREAGDYGHVVAIDFIHMTLLCEMNCVLFSGHKFQSHRLLATVVQWENAIPRLETDVAGKMLTFLNHYASQREASTLKVPTSLMEESGIQLRTSVIKILIENLQGGDRNELDTLALKLLTIVSVHLELPFETRSFTIPDSIYPAHVAYGCAEARHLWTTLEMFYSVWSDLGLNALNHSGDASESHLATLSDAVSERLFFFVGILMVGSTNSESGVDDLMNMFTPDVISEISDTWNTFDLGPFLPIHVPGVTQEIFFPDEDEEEDECEDCDISFVFDQRDVGFDESHVTDLGIDLFNRYQKDREPQQLLLQSRFKHLPFDEREKQINRYLMRQKQRTKNRMVNLAKTLNGGRQLHHAIIVDKGRTHIWDMTREDRLAEIALYREGYMKELADKEGSGGGANRGDGSPADVVSPSDEKNVAKKNVKAPKLNKKTAKKGVNKAQAIRDKTIAKAKMKLVTGDEEKKTLLVKMWRKVMSNADEPQKLADEVLSFATGQKRALDTFDDFPAIADRLKTAEARFEIAYMMLEDLHEAHLKYSTSVFCSPTEITLCRKSLEILFRLVQDIFTQFRSHIDGSQIMFMQEVLLSIGFKDSSKGMFHIWNEAQTDSLEKGVRLLSKPKTVADFRVAPGTEARFQLEYMSTVMDRTLGSGSDPRVLFKPDAWQKDLLDIVDLQESALVVAPTASGKTFVAYYAMEQTLRLDDDSVCLFVAPTTALARQVEAEIYSRMGTKAYQKNCKTVLSGTMFQSWANEPLSCQLLVTVPECMELILTCSGKDQRAWINRLKYVIYDEIHCISDTEESRGKIYERLLMLTPCPFIALSATIGNTEEFHRWLKMCSSKKSNTIHLIQHHERFADLRTLLYSNNHGGHIYVLNPWSCLHFETISVNGLSSDFYMASNDAVEFFDTLHSILISKGLTTEAATWKSSLDPEQFFYDGPIRAIVKKKYREYVAAMKSRFEILVGSKVIDHALFNEIVSDLLQHRPLSQSDSCEKSWIDKTGASAVATKSVKQLGASVKVDNDVVESLEDATSSALSLEEALRYETSIPSGNYLVGKRFYEFIKHLDDLNLLPTLVFNFSRSEARTMTTLLIRYMLDQQYNKYYGTTEATIRTKAINKKRMDEYNEKMKVKVMSEKLKGMSRAQREDQGIDKGEMTGDGDDEVIEKPKDIAEEFDPAFSFANPIITTASPEEIDELMSSVKDRVDDELLKALQRGIGMHHEALPKAYRVAVEQLFRLGYLKIVVTGTSLSLGVNMPCRTAVFAGDNLELTPILFKQTSGRSGRRGYDGQGNVVFWDFGFGKVQRLLSTTLSRLTGQWPVDNTFIARTANLLCALPPSEIEPVKEMIDQLYKTPLYLINNLTKASPEKQLEMTEFYGKVTTIGYESTKRLLQSTNLLSEDLLPAGMNSVLISLYREQPDNFFLSWIFNTGLLHELFVDHSPDEAAKTLIYILSKLVKRKVFPPAVLKEKRFQSKSKDSNSIFGRVWNDSNGDAVLKKLNSIVKSNIRDYIEEVGLLKPVDRESELRFDTLGLSFLDKSQEGSQYQPCTVLAGCEDEPQQISAMFSPFSLATGVNDEGDLLVEEFVASARHHIPIEADMIACYDKWECQDLKGDKTSLTSDYINAFMTESTLKNIIVSHGILPSDAWFILDDWRSLLIALSDLCRDHAADSGKSDEVMDVIIQTSSRFLTLLKSAETSAQNNTVQ
eukprot:GHVH01006360.1.p1 GENE.GHVH01006360.1~~GHVH01006360.1.p1  ORF type:complete len:1893 (+),score=317.06 GHVH01006360.1:103-5781(+)